MHPTNKIALSETALDLAVGGTRRNAMHHQPLPNLVKAVSDGSSPAVRLFAVAALLEAGAFDEALEALATAYAWLRSASEAERIAELLLQAARTPAVGANDSDNSAGDSERLIRMAAELSPRSALSALALHYQRQDRIDRAVQCLEQLRRLEPANADCAIRLGRLLETSGRVQEALAVYLELTDAAPSSRNVLVVADRIGKLISRLAPAETGKIVRIALLSNATVTHLESYLTVGCMRAGLRPVFYSGRFDQYTQEILDRESELYAFDPEIIICAIHASRLFPVIHDYPFDLTLSQREFEVNAGLSRLQHLLDALTARSSALVLVHNMVAPQLPSLGVQDLRDELGQAALFAEINLRLARLVRERYQNVFVLDEDRLQARCGKERATDPRLWLSARIPWSESLLELLTSEYMRFIRALRGLSRKCIVVDLDNTLWGGTIGEDGLAGLKLGAEAPGNAFIAFQRELDRLSRRGVLLAICSKNNLEDALAVFEQHPDMVLKLSSFAAHRINWEPKEANLTEIAAELNIGLDSLVFLDDNPVERARVRAALPQVLTPEMPTDPARYRQALLSLDVFDTLSFTDEDRQRARMYAEQRERRESEANIGERTLDEYLAALEIVAEIDSMSEVALPRVAQLTTKTNQFNLTTHRYTEAQIRDKQASGWLIGTMRVRDRFGDNGLVGVVIASPSRDGTVEIDSLLLSCRVMGRSLENALVSFVADQARLQGATRLRGWFLPSSKNAPAKDCYARLGFSLIERRPEGGELWELRLDSATVALPEWLTLRSPALVAR